MDHISNSYTCLFISFQSNKENEVISIEINVTQFHPITIIKQISLSTKIIYLLHSCVA